VPVVIAVGAVAEPAAAASYGYASAGVTTVAFRADYGVENRVVITRSGRTVTIDDRVAVQPGKGCKQVKGDKTRVRCTNSPSRPGNDQIHGGNGNDILQGDAGDDQLNGGNGDDLLAGMTGRDRMDGGAGNDRLGGDPSERTAAADVLRGGAGRDVVDYSNYHKAISVDLDGASGDDGLPGERDTVGADLEDISGSYGSDGLVGNASANATEGSKSMLSSAGDRSSTSTLTATLTLTVVPIATASWPTADDHPSPDRSIRRRGSWSASRPGVSDGFPKGQVPGREVGEAVGSCGGKAERRPAEPVGPPFGEAWIRWSECSPPAGRAGPG